MSPSGYQRASADFCFGREAFCQHLSTQALRCGCALLFGGRQAGKTTVLLRLQRTLSQQPAHVSVLSSVDVPVYIDLASLPVEASPSDFFRHLAFRADEACRTQLKGYKKLLLPSDSHAGKRDDLGMFVRDIIAILARCGEAEVRLLFLLDEAKRVLGGRFPRGFQDNLFSLLYGEHDAATGRLSLVFSGAQELLRFAEDETSPIGSRAAQCFVMGLDDDSVCRMAMRLAGPKIQLPDPEEFARAIAARTGGHPGLTVRLISDCLAESSFAPSAVAEAAAGLVEREATLFRIWTEALSPEAKAIHSLFSENDAVERQSIALALTTRAFLACRASQVAKEYAYTGLAREEGMVLRKANAIYWDFIEACGGYASAPSQCSPGAHSESGKRKCQEAVEKLEFCLRDYVTDVYVQKWGVDSDRMMKTAIGTDSWSKIEDNLTKAGSHYPKSATAPLSRTVDGMYLGQLIQLLLWGKAWPLFQAVLKDKREVERWRSEILPVRNDLAHARKVPEKELSRCWVACDDWIVTIEQANRAD